MARQPSLGSRRRGRDELRQVLRDPSHCAPGTGRPVRETAEGQLILRERTTREVKRLIERYTPSPLTQKTISELTRLREREARRYGMEGLPGGESKPGPPGARAEGALHRCGGVPTN